MMDESILAEMGVSRETQDRLAVYADLLMKWNRKINLVGPCSADQVWRRHILDCAQIDRIAPEAGAWADVGSGGGLPGLIVAAIRQGRPGHSMHLYESDQRKCAFLIEAARAMQVDVSVENVRVEQVRRQFDIISARAFAPLPRIFDLTRRMATMTTAYILLKGRTASEEIDSARKLWRFSVDRISSRTDDEAAILSIREVIHA